MDDVEHLGRPKHHEVEAFFVALWEGLNDVPNLTRFLIIDVGEGDGETSPRTHHRKWQSKFNSITIFGFGNGALDFVGRRRTGRSETPVIAHSVGRRDTGFVKSESNSTVGAVGLKKVDADVISSIEPQVAWASIDSSIVDHVEVYVQLIVAFCHKEIERPISTGGAKVLGLFCEA